MAPPPAETTVEAAPAPAASPSTTLGGYGQFVAHWLKVGPDGPYQGDASLRRLVLFVYHSFGGSGPPLAVYTELEWEDAVSGAGLGGSAEVEQAAIVWKPRRGEVEVQAGLLLVPMGIVNRSHEPPAFFGVERPETDTWIIPTTWRELGFGVQKRLGPVKAEVDLLTPLDPTRLGPDGVVNARTLGSGSPVDGVAAAARVEVEPTLGLVLGASGYASQAGGAGDWFDEAGERRRLSVPLFAAELDGRGVAGPVSARAVGVSWWLPESDDLMEARRADGSPWFPESAGVVPTRMWGGYVELGLDLGRLFPEASWSVSPFARLEGYNTQLAVPEGYAPDPARSVQVATVGVSWKVIPAVVVKGDVQLRDRRYGLDELQWNAGFGYMF